MSITEAAIRYNRVTLVALLSMLLGGFGAYQSMPRAEDPGFIIRVAQVVTKFPGASPERVEQLVTDPLEKVIQELPELNIVFSQSRTSVSIIFVEVRESYTNMRPIWDSLRRKIDRVQNELPDDALPSEVNDEFGEVFGIVISVTGDGYSYAELKDVADELRNEFLLMPAVAKVDIYGAQEERLFVEYSNARLAEAGLSPGQLIQILSARNIIIPGGDVSTGQERLVLEPSGNFESVDDVARSLIQLPKSGEVVALQDIAQVYRGYIDPPEAKVSATGQPGLALAIAMREGGNIVELGEKVDIRLAELQAQYAIGLEFDFVARQPAEVNRIVEIFRGNLLQAVGVVTLVMLLTLGIRTGLIVATLIPTTMVMSLLVMSILEIGLDQVSLAALIIALGMLVDNAIVMSENTQVLMQQGKTSLEAAIQSASELRVPLLTSSLTTAAAFLPIYLAESQTGEYTAPLFKVVTITLLCSWLIALTIIPMLSVQFMRAPKTNGSPYDTRFYRGYRATLRTILRFRWIAMIMVALLFWLGMVGFSKVPALFFPSADKPFVRVDLELPFGAPLDRTEAVVAAIEEHMFAELQVNPERTEGVTNWIAYVGGSGPRFVLQHSPEPNRSHFAFMLVNSTGDLINDHIMASLQDFAFENFPDLKIRTRRVEYGPPVSNPVEIRLSGRDQDHLFSIVDQVKVHLATLPGTNKVDDNWGARIKKLRIDVDEARARRAGITNRDIAISLQAALSGIELTQYREGDDIIPVTLRSETASTDDIGKVERINVQSQSTGRSVPLSQVADIEVLWQPAEIFRRNRLKTVTVSSGLSGDITAAAINAELEPWLNAQQQSWGPGYRWEFGGEVESAKDSNAAIGAKLPIALFCILILLVMQFNSIRRTAIVLATIPLALIGVAAGLLIAKSYIGFMTTLGIVSLFGIVINNAIVLLERINIEIEENGLEPFNAIVEAAQRRLRPILLTTATTVLGLLPLWYGGGRMWEPMAVSIIFGLLFGTVLTLGVVPVLYAIFFRVKRPQTVV